MMHTVAVLRMKEAERKLLLAARHFARTGRKTSEQCSPDTFRRAQRRLENASLAYDAALGRCERMALKDGVPR